MNLLERIGFKKAKEQKEIEEEAYEKAAEEISTNDYKEGLKAKAFSQAGGNENKADAIYIELRAEQLIVQIREKRKEQRLNDPEYQKKLKKKKLKKRKKALSIFGAFIIVVLLSIISFFTIDYSQSIATDKIEILNPDFEIEKSEDGDKDAVLTGRIRNNSDKELQRISVRVRIYNYDYTPPEEVLKKADSGEGLSWEEVKKMSFWGKFRDTLNNESSKLVGMQVDTEDLNSSYLNVPAGETKSLSLKERYSSLTINDDWVWDYEILEASSY